MDIAEVFRENYVDLNEICNSILDGVAIASAQKDFIFWNHAAKQILGDEPDHDTDPKEWSRRYRLYDLKTQQHLTYEKLPMIMALNGEEFFDYRIMTKNISHPDGIILSVNGRPIRSGTATVAGITTFRDITSFVNQEIKIQEERNFYERILDLIPGIVFIKDLDGKFIYGNKNFHELLKTSEVRGKTTEDFLIKDMADKIYQHDKLVIESGRSMEFDEVIYWKDGTKSVFHTVRFPYIPTGVEIKGVCAVAKDVTKELEAQALIEDERNRSSQISKLASIGILSAEIAHEIKNPLMILQTASDVISHVINDERPDKNLIREKVAVLNETIVRMNKVASSLSLLSRDSSIEQTSEFTVRNILEDVRSLCMFKTRKMEMEMEIKVQDSPCLEKTITANRVQLSEVLLNLVMNALDAVEKVKNPEVTVSCEIKRNDLYIKVFDNGKGVVPELQAKIFEPLFTTKPLNKGTGLGLSISKKIMERHQGELYYEENNNVHSFVIKLPMNH